MSFRLPTGGVRSSFLCLRRPRGAVWRAQGCRQAWHGWCWALAPWRRREPACRWRQCVICGCCVSCCHDVWGGVGRERPLRHSWLICVCGCKFTMQKRLSCYNILEMIYVCATYVGFCCHAKALLLPPMLVPAVMRRHPCYHEWPLRVPCVV